LGIQNRLTAGEVVATNLYTRTQIDELFGTWTYRIPDGSLAIEKVQGLVATLASKVNRAELQNGVSDLTLAKVTAETVRVNSLLDIPGETTANLIRAANIESGTLTAGVGAFNKFSSEHIFDNGSTLYLAYEDTPFAIRLGKAARIGINCDNASNSGVALECAGAARFSGAVVGSDFAAGSLSIIHPSASNSAITTAEIGSGVSYCRFTHGHHIDSFTRNSDVGRALYLNYYSNTNIRCGKDACRFGINCDPGNVQFDVAGSGRFSGPLSASNFPSSSDARLKIEVASASLEECTRLVRTITPSTYKRIDLEGTPARIGYIAQHWDRELTGGYRCIMGAGEDADGPLLALDYSRIVPVLHGALLSALARIEALEKRLT
jgi:hypothetical protein